MKNQLTESASRRLFLKTSGMFLGGMPLGWNLFLKSFNSKIMTAVEPLKPELVKEFVANAHGNLDKVKELLEQAPGLLNSAWDWGNGDFETGLNAAGHVGRSDIAEFLLSKGARMDLFCATMLGRMDIVKPILDFKPDLKSSKGPHGLALLHHAEKGGEKAREVLEYLKAIGAS